VEQEKLQK
jgi:hypothetical protein